MDKPIEPDEILPPVDEREIVIDELRRDNLRLRRLLENNESYIQYLERHEPS